MARRYGTSGGATFRVEGIEPTDLSGHPEPVRRMYWRWVVELTLTAKDRELSMGLDRFGMMMVPISAKTRRYRRSVKGPADPNAPPLQPAHELSRTRSLFRGRAFPDRAEFYWGFDEFSGASWGRILKFHARGKGHLPVRDVIGLSPQSTQWVRAQALGRWGAWLRDSRLGIADSRLKPKIPNPKSKVPKGWAIGATKAKAVPKIEPTGHTNLDNYTFGIGASKDEVRRMIDSGHFTGFRQLHTFKPGTGPSAGPGPPLKPIPIGPPPTHPNPIVAQFLRVTHSESVPVRVIDDLAEAEKRWKWLIDFLPSSYNWEENVVYVNPHALHWKDPSAFAEMDEVGWFSGSDVAHAAHHEIGHYRHARAITPEVFGRWVGLKPSDAKAIAIEVSGYAATNRVEFVAEVYAGLKGGKGYSPAIMDLYRRYKGPEP